MLHGFTHAEDVARDVQQALLQVLGRENWSVEVSINETASVTITRFRNRDRQTHELVVLNEAIRATAIKAVEGLRMKLKSLPDGADEATRSEHTHQQTYCRKYNAAAESCVEAVRSALAAVTDLPVPTAAQV